MHRRFRPPPQPRTASYGVAGMVLGIIGFLLALIPCVGLIAVPFLLIGLALSLIGGGRPEGRGMAIAGSLLSMLGLIVCVAWFMLSYFTMDSFQRALDHANRETK